MGWVREKYTKQYFTGVDDTGKLLSYGVEPSESKGLREFDQMLLDRINFKDAHVLEIGYGRGESVSYFLNKGAASYIGVDFALPAYELASELITSQGLSEARLFCADALEFIRDSGAEVIKKPIDVLVLLDVVEHIPRSELEEILTTIKPYLADKAIIVINTPIYQVDNDVIENGLDEKNHVGAIDHADFIEETKGMHCNKYSFISLPNFMSELGYANLTERQLYVKDKLESNPCHPIPSFRKLWEEIYSKGFPVYNEYKRDIHEYAYIQDHPLELISNNALETEEIKIVGVSEQIEAGDGQCQLTKEIKSGDIVFDVGGYVGLSSLYFSHKVGEKGSVFCFEPNPMNLNRIRTNLSENEELERRIKLFNVGLGEESGVQRLLLSDDIESGYSSTSQLVKGGKTAIPQIELRNLGFYDYDVAINTLDEFVAVTGTIPHFIKVDIEGAEVPFIKGALKTLKENPITLNVEIHSPLATYYILGLLNSLGYRAHVLRELWGNRIEILAKKCEKEELYESKLFEADIQKLFSLYRVHKTNSALENKEQMLENLSSQKNTLENENKVLRAQITNLKKNISNKIVGKLRGLLNKG